MVTQPVHVMWYNHRAVILLGVIIVGGPDTSNVNALFRTSHTFSQSGILPDSSKVSAIHTWPMPRNVSEVRAIFGLASYYCCYVKKFAEIAEPVHR